MTHRPEPLARFRSLFPGVARGTYLNVAQRCLMPTPVREAAVEHLDRRMDPGWSKEESFALVEGTREAFARFVNADPDEIAFTKNVTEGLGQLADGVRWEAGDNLLLCPDVEHPANVYPWYNQARRRGVEVRSVPTADGRIDPDAVLAAADDHTRLLSVPTVSFSPGFVTDLAPLARACRDAGIRLVVDAAQSVGILHTDVRAMGVDALAVATQKGLLACYGQGFLYCGRDFAEELEPPTLGRFGVAHEAGEHETAVADGGWTYAPAARRFDGGNYNYLGIRAARAGLELLEELGSRAVEEHVRALAGRLAGGLLERGLPVCGGAPGRHLGSIVAVGTSGGGRHYTADDPEMNRLHAHLEAHGVHLSVRRGVLRFSLHAYNDASDVDRVLELVDGWERGAG